MALLADVRVSIPSSHGRSRKARILRNEFAKAIEQILENHPEAAFLTGDLGFNAFEGIRERFPGRFLNTGVAEQHMIGFAAGLALSGIKPWVYSIAPFVTCRVTEFIRNDLCFHNLPVKIIGNGGGYTYGVMGSTHHALEDLGILKTLPNLTLYFPCAGDQVNAAVHQMSQQPGPSYLRLAVSPCVSSRPVIGENPATLTRCYKKGRDLTVIGVGHAVQIVLTALDLARNDLNINVFGLGKFPLDTVKDSALSDAIRDSRKVLVVEEHYLSGGFGETLSALFSGKKFEILAAKYDLNQRYGSAAFHLDQSGISPKHVLAAIEKELCA